MVCKISQCCTFIGYILFRQRYRNESRNSLFFILFYLSWTFFFHLLLLVNNAKTKNVWKERAAGEKLLKKANASLCRCSFGVYEPKQTLFPGLSRPAVYGATVITAEGIAVGSMYVPSLFAEIIHYVHPLSYNFLWGIFHSSQGERCQRKSLRKSWGKAMFHFPRRTEL